MEILVLKNKEAEPYLDEILKMRLKNFIEFPYLYEGDEKYEQKYLEVLMESKTSLLIIVKENDKVIATGTGLCLNDEVDFVKNPYINEDINKIFYISEVVVNKEYRKSGIAKIIGDKFIEYAFQNNYKKIVFCSVNRNSNHKLRPKNYYPNENIWIKYGFSRSDKKCYIPWKDIDEEIDSQKELQFYELKKSELVAEYCVLITEISILSDYLQIQKETFYDGGYSFENCYDSDIIKLENLTERFSYLHKII